MFYKYPELLSLSIIKINDYAIKFQRIERVMPQTAFESVI